MDMKTTYEQIDEALSKFEASINHTESQLTNIENNMNNEN